MRLYRFQGENTLTELVRKLYEIDKKGLTLTSVGSQVAQANPRLDLTGKSLAKKLRAGTSIIAPDVDGAHHTAAARPLREEAADAIPTERLFDRVHEAIMSTQQDRAERLREFGQALDAIEPTVDDEEISQGFDTTRSNIDEQRAQLDKTTEATLAAVERARQALYRQRELLRKN